MDEQLVAYLRNTLDPATRRAVEALLRTDPDAAARVHVLRQTLAPWEDDAETVTPPPDLVGRTLDRVAEHRRRPLPTAPPPRASQFGAPGTRRFRPADVAVAAAVLLLVGSLALAWLPGSRARASDLACQNRMRTVWHALEQYSEASENHGEFPRVESAGPRGVAGSFVPVLQDAGLLGPDVSLVCSPDATAGPRPSLRELEQLYRDQPETFKSVALTLAGSYAYSLGYTTNDGVLVGLRRDAGGQLPLLADAPPSAGLGLSPNHDGRGQNVLYIGGNVRWCTQRTVGVNCDDIYLNQDGRLRTGRNWGDTVLAPSGVTPFGE